MQRRRLMALVIILGVAVFLASVITLSQAAPASAQCGSQASSCKNCHETQAKDPVNNDGTGWHESHAFGDFCYICHAGNSQATDEVAAHTGMVPPMSDIQAACAQCHPNDLQARADVYAAKLGAPVAASTSQPATAATAPAQSMQPNPAAQAVVPPPAQVAANDPNLTDYVARYNEQVLHQGPTNWGNVILIGIFAALVLAGLYLVNRREGWISVSLQEKRPVGKEYPADVLQIADRAERLSPSARRSLERLLDKPGAMNEVLSALEKLAADQSSADRE